MRAADRFGMVRRTFYVHCANKLWMALAPAFSIGGVPWKYGEFGPENIERVSQRDGRRVELSEKLSEKWRMKLIVEA